MFDILSQHAMDKRRYLKTVRKRDGYMQFNSYIFILLFLPSLILGYYLTGKFHVKLSDMYLLLFSIIFYLYGSWKYSVILGISILGNHFLCVLLAKVDQKKKIILVGDIVINVMVLFYFKYFSFFLDIVNDLIGFNFTIGEIILPLGISFFTFQQIMYVVNVYEGKFSHRFFDYLTYILYFPKIIMGPLVEPKALIDQFKDPDLKRVNWDNISYGIKIFSFGLFKKLILADTFSKAVSWGFANTATSTAMDCFLTMLFYTFEIYFDFSGYSDMAVGVSRMLNISLPMNFNSPYKAISIRDFWKRWHMSLTKFFTKYVYIPLGGNKNGVAKTYINTMTVFVVSGIWHGANWTFILWGCLHGVLSVLDRIFENSQKKVMEAVRWFVTFLMINILWLLFRSESIGQWWSLLVKMFTFQDMSISWGMLDSFLLPETTFLMRTFKMETVNAAVRGFSMLLFTLCAYVICLLPENNYKKLEQNNYCTMIMAAIAFVWSFLCLSSESVFVYFNF